MIHCSLLNGQTFGITNEMSGKMEGMYSLNTSANINPFCLKMRECAGVICKSCYTKGKEKMHTACHTAWVNNYHVLSENVLKDRELPIINQQVFRFDAHGELVNRIHYKNLIKIAEANPRTMFALWTKHLAVINAGGLIRLDNLINVFSVYNLNETKPKRPKGFDKVFAVYSRPFIREHADIKINCAKSCNDCRLCYEKNDVPRVNELIKYSGDSK